MTYERPHLRDLAGYVPGLQPREPRLKLNTNENPYPPSVSVGSKLASISADILQRYPDPLAQQFRTAAARVHGLSPDQVIATNGGDELLRLALTTYLNPGMPLGVLTPSYGLYAVLAAVHGAPLTAVPLLSDWSLPTDAADQWNASAAPLAIITNPHAPSGTLVSVTELDQLARSFNGVLLIDEAYIDFVDPERGHQTSRLVQTYPNVLLLRTLSKGYSLAGLRLAYGLGAPDLIAPMLSKTKNSYNVDTIAQLVGTAALDDQRGAELTWQAVCGSRLKLMQELTIFGFECHPSQANFLLATVPTGTSRPSAEEVYRALMSQGIYVRWFDEDRLRDKLRISIGTPEENSQLLEALKLII